MPLPPNNYDWSKAAENETATTEYAERLGAGTHDVSIVKIIHEGKNGRFETASGDPKILIVFADANESECADMFALSPQAGWRIAKLMGAFNPPANLEAMTADGVKPADFGTPEFADANLVGRKLKIRLEYTTGKDGNEYANVEPLRADQQVPDAAADGIDTDEIPF